MKIGLIADSNGDIGALENACRFLLEKEGAARLFFLGGYCNDLDDLSARLVLLRQQSLAGSFDAAGLADFVISRCARVPDKQCDSFDGGSTAKILPEMVASRIAILVHDKADLRREDIEPATFLFHGCSKAPGVVKIGSRFFITPGSLSGTDQPSFGLVSHGLNGAEFIAFGTDCREIGRWSLTIQARPRLTAR